MVTQAQIKPIKQTCWANTKKSNYILYSHGKKLLMTENLLCIKLHAGMKYINMNTIHVLIKNTSNQGIFFSCFPCIAMQLTLSWLNEEL